MMMAGACAILSAFITLGSITTPNGPIVGHDVAELLLSAGGGWLFGCWLDWIGSSK